MHILDIGLEDAAEADQPDRRDTSSVDLHDSADNAQLPLLAILPSISSGDVFYTSIQPIEHGRSTSESANVLWPFDSHQGYRDAFAAHRAVQATSLAQPFCSEPEIMDEEPVADQDAMYWRRQSFAYQQDIYATPIEPLRHVQSGRRASLSCKSSALSRLDLNLTLGVEGKPYSYAQLITYAIAHSATGRLTLAEIYDWCLANFPYFKEQTNTGWKNSIRHNLSLNKIFVREPRPFNEPGKGAYWCLNEEKINADVKSTSRSRKRSHSALEPLMRSFKNAAQPENGRLRSASESVYPNQPAHSPSCMHIQEDQDSFQGLDTRLLVPDTFDTLAGLSPLSLMSSPVTFQSSTDQIWPLTPLQSDFDMFQWQLDPSFQVCQTPIYALPLTTELCNDVAISHKEQMNMDYYSQAHNLQLSKDVVMPSNATRDSISSLPWLLSSTTDDLCHTSIS